MLADKNVRCCSAEEHEKLLYMVKAGMVFEVQEWIAEGKPTLRPRSSSRFASSLRKAVAAGNHSMVRVLWESAWQDMDEQKYALAEALDCSNGPGREIARYLLKNGCPLSRWVNGCDLCLSHDGELIALGVARGIRIVGPEGFADALGKTGSKWLIGYYKRSVGDYPELYVEAAKALYHAIADSRIRLIALLRWAGVDPFYCFSEEVCLEELELDYSYEVMPVGNLYHSDKFSEVLEVLKLRPTVSQWFDILKNSFRSSPKEVQLLLHLIPDHQSVLRESPEDAGELVRSVIRMWSYDFCSCAKKRELRYYVYYLISIGVQALHVDVEGVKLLRSILYAIKEPENVVHLLWFMYESADDQSRKSMYELVRTAKMNNMVKQYYPWLLYDLGFLNTPAKRVVLDGEKRWKLDKFELAWAWRDFAKNPELKTELKRRGRKLRETN